MDFNSKFNSCINDVGCTSSVFNNELFQQYCMVFMAIGIVPCILRYWKIIYVTSRKALNSTLEITISHTRCALLPHIPLLDAGIAKRYLNHVHTGFNHDNSLVRFVFQNTMYTDSRIGQHIRYLAYKCIFYISDLTKLVCTPIYCYY